MAPQIEIRLLGRFMVRRDGDEVAPVAFGGRQARKLVRVLITRRGGLVPVDELVEFLWPHRAPKDPASNVKVLVNRARRALGDPDLIATGAGGYAFSPSESCFIDTEAFRATVAAAKEHLGARRSAAALREFKFALALWRGEPLPEDTYEDWSGGYRAELDAIHLDALEAAAATALDVRDPNEAVGLAQQATAREPLRERANLLLVRALAAAGDTAGALAAYDSYRTRVADELGLDPSPEAAELHLRILRGEPVGRTARTSTPASVDPHLEELPFVGRERELAAIEKNLAHGRGVVVVAGRSGVGKSRLLAEVARRATLPVISARAFLAGREQPWSLARSLVREALALDADAARSVPRLATAALAEVLPEIEDYAPVADASLDPETRRALILEGVLRVIENAAAPGLLVILDDLQWADATSLELVALATNRVVELRVVIAHRSDEAEEAGAMGRFLREMVRAGSVESISLDPLSAAEIAQLVADDDLATVIAAGTDRTPLAVEETIRALQAQGSVIRDAHGRWRPRVDNVMEVARASARAGQERMILARVERLAPRRRNLVSLLAVLGREVPARVLGHALDVETRVVLDDLELLARADLVRFGDHGWRTAHDFIGDTVAATLGRAEKGRTHGLLADALRAHGADPSEIALHLAEAGDSDAAAEAFATAAAASLKRFANREAERLAEAGLALATPDGTRTGLLETRAEARARVGNLGGARDDLRAALTALEDPSARARVFNRMARLALATGDLARASELGELALVEAGRDRRSRAEALVVAAIADMNAERFERADERFAEALSLFQALGDSGGVADIIDAQAMATFMNGRIAAAVDSFERAARLFEDSGNLLRVVTPRSTRGHGLTFMGRAEDALSDADAALALAETLGMPDAEAMALWHRSEVLVALGRIDEALQGATRAVTLAESIGHRSWTAMALRALGIALEAADDLAGAGDAFRRVLDVGATVSLFASWGAARLALVLIAQGDFDEAGRYVSAALMTGPPLAGYEARLAEAELSAARGDAGTRDIASRALVLAEVGGHAASAARLRELAYARR
ncbi:MAG: BTAD domain-containing putative transcriptional regulator [Actinomycetota bacterium]